MAQSWGKGKSDKFQNDRKCGLSDCIIKQTAFNYVP